MAIDAKERKRQKRNRTKKEARRLTLDKLNRRDKLTDYYWEAKDALSFGQYEEAVQWCTKFLEIEDRDDEVWDMAVESARRLRDEETIVALQLWRLRAGRLFDWKECFDAGKMALKRKEYQHAQELFEGLLEHPDLQGFGARKPLRDLRQHLEYARVMAATVSSASGKPVVMFSSEQGSRSLPPPSVHSTSTEPVVKTGTGNGTIQVPRAELSKRDVPAALPPEELPDVTVRYEASADLVIKAVRDLRQADPRSFELALKAYRHSFRVSFDQLLCIPTLSNVESLWYQQETARKVMKTFRGRAVLADEVGLGKTIEAGIIFKEYFLRGLVRTALVLAPSSLVNQWREELEDKFAVRFASSNDPLFKQDSGRFWSQPLIVASVAAARTARHFEAVTSRFYDLVIVDEAHHLRNNRSRTWQLVNKIQKTFLLLLTATPVQNKLEELYSLVTILKPGHLSTRKAFLDQFVTRGKPTDPRNRAKLKELLKEIMVRNTRSVAQLRLPPRFAFTTRVGSTDLEREFYDGISSLVSQGARGAVSGTSIMTLRKLLETAGSSHHAAVAMLEKLKADPDPDRRRGAQALLALGKRIPINSKTAKVIDLLRSLPDKKIIFVNYRATLHHLCEVLTQKGIAHSFMHGGLTPGQKQAAVKEFRESVPVLVTTGIGGEGHNLQFCNVMINFDLPWNPMEIEQRIGRIHRIGQEREVQVYNFCAAGSLEEHILEVLDRKINMFELVVGEVDMILGHLQDEQEFSEMVFEIYTQHTGQTERKEAFDQFAERLKKARHEYHKTKELDEKLFGEDFGV